MLSSGPGLGHYWLDTKTLTPARMVYKYLLSEEQAILAYSWKTLQGLPVQNGETNLEAGDRLAEVQSQLWTPQIVTACRGPASFLCQHANASDCP